MPTEKIIIDEVEVESTRHETPNPRQSSGDIDNALETEAQEDSESVKSNISEPVSIVEGQFDPTQYIDLTGKSVCRAVYPISVGNQKRRIKLVCGRTGCSFHKGTTNERARGRFYVRQSKGGIDHGRADLPSLTKKEFDEAYDAWSARFHRDVQRSQPEEEIEFEKVETPPARTKANFFDRMEMSQGRTKVATKQREEAVTQTPVPPVPNPHHSATRVLRSARARVQIRSPRGGSISLDPGSDTHIDDPRDSLNDDGGIWYGAENIDGARKVIDNAEVAFEWQAQEGWRLAGMWKSVREAAKWALEAPMGMGRVMGKKSRGDRANERDEEDAEDTEEQADGHEGPVNVVEPEIAEEQPKDKRSKKKKSDKKKKKKKRSSRKRREDSDSSPSDSSKSSKSGDGSDPSSSSSPSSSSDDSSDSDSSTSSSDHRRHRKKERKSKKGGKGRKSKKKGKNERRSRKAGPSLYGRASSDPSTGTEDKVHGRHLTDQKLERKLCPQGMASRDREEFTDLLLDVTHLPGMYRNGTEPDELNEVIGELKGVGDAIISASKSRKTKTQLNTQWNNERRTALLKVTTEENLLDMIDRISSGEKPAFKKQAYGIYAFMRRCRYQEEDIEAYLRDGLWPRVIEDTFKWNMEFLEQVRRVIAKHRTWDGLAFEMIKHHGRKLADIRNYAVDYRLYLLEVYVYFRENRKQKFQNATIQEALWRIPKSIGPGVNEDHTNEFSQANTNRNSGCAHCKSKALHEAMGVNLGQANCPLKDVPRTQARQLAGDILQHFKKNPTCEKAEYVNKKVLGTK